MSSYPQEFYGQLTNCHDSDWFSVLDNQHCPFLNRSCTKRRNDNSSQSIGSCVITASDESVIICPNRFLQNHIIFHNAITLLQPAEEYLAIPEFSVPGGHIDYLLIGKTGTRIVDYIGIEIQAVDTTNSGSLWKARNDLLTTGKMKEHYAFGLNWKDAAKRSLIQLYHKVTTLESVRKRLLLVIQQEFFQYLSREFTTTHLKQRNEEMSAFFHVYELDPTSSMTLTLRLASELCTDATGINQLLRLGHNAHVEEANIYAQITKKMPSAFKVTQQPHLCQRVQAKACINSLFEDEAA